MDMRELLEKMDDFAGAAVGQKSGDQVRGTERAKTGGKQHPFKGRLVGGSCEESVLPELDKASKERNVHREIGESWAKFQENMDDPAVESRTNYHANRTGFARGARDSERHDLDVPAPQVWGLKINGKVWNKDGKDVTFNTREAALRIRDSILKNRPDLEIGLVTKGGQQGVSEAEQLSVQQLATISDEALDKAYGYGRSTPGNSFGWQANLKSAAYAKQMIDKGVTDIEVISDAIHKGWNVTAQAFVRNPEQFDDTAKLQAAGKLEAKLQQRAKLMNIGYAQLANEEQEKDRVVARALLQALKGTEGVAEGWDKLTPQQKAHEYNLDAAQREMDRRHAQGEDMTGAKIDKKTYKIVKPKQQGVAEGGSLDNYRQRVQSQGFTDRPEERNADRLERKRRHNASLDRIADIGGGSSDEERAHQAQQRMARDEYKLDRLKRSDDDWENTFDMMRDRMNRYQWSSQRNVDPEQLAAISNIKYEPRKKNEAVQAKTDDKLLAYYAQRKAEKQQQGATATSQPVESQTRPSSFQAKPMSMSLEDWKKEILAKYPNARFATERRPNGSTLAGELGGGSGQGGLGIYSPSTGEVRVGPTGALSQPLRIHPKQQGMAEGAVKELSGDLRTMRDDEFQSRYKMTKAEARANLKNKDKNVAEELTPTANTTMAQTTGTTTPAAGATTTATPQDVAKSQQQQALAKRNLGALKTAGVDIDPGKAMPALQKAETGAPMNTTDQAAIAKMAPALGKILQGPQGQQLANLVKSAGAMK